MVTGTSLFDGHDAAINVMRRIVQATGAEVIHLGHNRSAKEMVDAVIQEDAQALAITSYQGGHNEYFQYIYDLLQEAGFGHVKIFGGGGGVILPKEIEALHKYGISRIYSPQDGRVLGLQGMINDMLQTADFAIDQQLPIKVGGSNGKAKTLALNDKNWSKHLTPLNPSLISRLITLIEQDDETHHQNVSKLAETSSSVVLGITGTGGAGKSSLVDELVRRFVDDHKQLNVAIVSMDPSKRKTGGALLGDRIRMNAIYNDRVYMRSLATRGQHTSVSKYLQQVLAVLKAAGFDLIILETSGIGQSGSEIVDFADCSLYVMTPEYGAATQLEKIDMIDYSNFIAVNKFDRHAAEDALRDVRKQYKRSHHLFDAKDESLPIIGTIAAQFGDPGTTKLYQGIMSYLAEKFDQKFQSSLATISSDSKKIHIVPPQRTTLFS